MTDPANFDDFLRNVLGMNSVELLRTRCELPNATERRQAQREAIDGYVAAGQPIPPWLFESLGRDLRGERVA